MINLNTIHLRSHAEGVCRDCSEHSQWDIGEWVHDLWPLTEYSLDILCLMALTEALGLEYGGFV